MLKKLHLFVEFFVYLRCFMICAIVDSRISKACHSRLVAEGFSVITLPPFDRLGGPIASHTDMLIARVENNLVINRDYLSAHAEVIERIKEAAPGYNIILDDSPIGAEYPCDCVYNCLVTEDKIYTAHTECQAIASLAQATKRTLVKINQGYPACTTLLLGKNALITADGGIAKVLSKDGFSVTLIENGDISLPPYEYGFIGGASGVFDNTVYFCGDVTAHRSFEAIKDAIEKTGMEYISLSDETLADIGGILFL